MRELKFTQKHSKSKKYAIKKRLVFRKGKKKIPTFVTPERWVESKSSQPKKTACMPRNVTGNALTSRTRQSISIT